MLNRHSDPGWLLHIGAGRSSVNSIVHAQARGYCMLATDLDPNAPGIIHATRSMLRSREDVEGITREVDLFARDHRLVGCYTTSSATAAIRAAARIRDLHSLPGLGLDQIESMLDRSEWKARLVTCGIETPASAVLASPGDLDQFLEIHPDVLLKPESGGRGSLGVSRVRAGEARNRELYDEARRVSDHDLVLAEVFVAGEEYSVDGVVRNGRFHLLHLGQKFSVRNLRGTLPTGYAWGALESGQRADEDPRWDRYQALASAAAMALELDETFLSLDVLDDGRAPTIIDLGVQLDAKVDRGLEFAGIDTAAVACAIATGESWQCEKDPGALHRGYALRFIYSDDDGRLCRESNPQDVSGHLIRNRWRQLRMPPSRVRIEWEKQTGDCVERPRSVSDLVAWTLVEGEDRDRAWMRANELEADELFTVTADGDGEPSNPSEWRTGKSDS